LSDSRGFTLIELLVVIAIIGILSSVVLASLSTARNKGSNAAIKSQLASLRSEAEILAQDNSGSYATICTAGTNTKKIFDAAVTSNGNTSTSTISYCAAASGTYVGAIDLKSPEGSYTGWCVDNTGVSKGITTDVTSSLTWTACGI
jgi:prepilin-type N-terminal cleavage/methylation domain-containing protein